MMLTKRVETLRQFASECQVASLLPSLFERLFVKFDSLSHSIPLSMTIDSLVHFLLYAVLVFLE